MFLKYLTKRKEYPNVLSPELGGLLEFICRKYKVPAYAMSKYLYVITKIHLKEFGEPVFPEAFYATCYGPQLKEVVEVLSRYGSDNVPGKFHFHLFCEQDLIKVEEDSKLAEIVAVVFDKVNLEGGHLVKLTYDDAWRKGYPGDRMILHSEIKKAPFPNKKPKNERLVRKLEQLCKQKEEHKFDKNIVIHVKDMRELLDLIQQRKG